MSETNNSTDNGIANTLRKLVDAYRHLQLDTPEDQKTHERLTALADRAIDALSAQEDGIRRDQIEKDAQIAENIDSRVTIDLSDFAEPDVIAAAIRAQSAPHPGGEHE